MFSKVHAVGIYRSWIGAWDHNDGCSGAGETEHPTLNLMTQWRGVDEVDELMVVHLLTTENRNMRSKGLGREVEK